MLGVCLSTAESTHCHLAPSPSLRGACCLLVSGHSSDQSALRPVPDWSSRESFLACVLPSDR